MKNYVIVAPRFATNSAGVRCLYELCARLNARGYPSYVAAVLMGVGDSYKVPSQTAPPPGAVTIEATEAFERVRAGAVVVYPDVVRGNPFNGGVVARWALNRPGLSKGTDTAFASNEHVFYYSNAYRRYFSEVAGKLHMPTLEPDFFYPPPAESPRTLELFYTGKSAWREGAVSRESVVEIGRTTPRRRDLPKLLRAAKRLWTFDNSTILTYEALLCGCPVTIVPDGTMTWEDYELSELGTEGIAWGDSLIETPPPNPGAIRARLVALWTELEKQLDHFVEVTQLSDPSCNLTRQETVP